MSRTVFGKHDLQDVGTKGLLTTKITLDNHFKIWYNSTVRLVNDKRKEKMFVVKQLSTDNLNKSSTFLSLLMNNYNYK